MKNIKKIITIILLLLILIIISLFLYNDYRVKHAKIDVKTVDNLDIEVYSEVKLKDLIKSINGKLLKNETINTKKTGKQTIKFEYINDENIKVPYSFDINIVDTTAPILSDAKAITLTKGYEGKLENKIFCADNYDDNPKCEIIGDYNLNEVVTTKPQSHSHYTLSKKKITLNLRNQQLLTSKI